MKKSIIYVAVCLLISLPSILQGFYQNHSSAQQEPAEPYRIILKLKSNIEVTPVFEAGAIKSLGLAEPDAISARYEISGQNYLFKEAVRNNISDRLKNVFIVEPSRAADLPAMVAEYEKLDIVEYAQPDYILELYDAPNDPLYNQQWSLNNTGQGFYHVERYDGCYNDTLVIMFGVDDADIDAAEVFDNPPDNTRTVIVAMIDTGVDLDHPDLAGRIWINPGEISGNSIDDDHNGYIDDINGWDFSGDNSFPPLSPDDDPTDMYGHGTHCSGIITAIMDNSIGIAGILDNCEIMALKFYPVMLSSFASRAIIYAADNGADVISMSWGYPWPVQILEDALEYARSKGVILVAASGNDEAELSNYPASYPTVITVGATNCLDEVTFFSTYGDYLDVCAPGRSVLSLRADSTDMYATCEADVHIIADNYYLASGTSMAAPHVAGVAAYLRAVSPGLTPDATQAIIQATADDIVDPYGTGANYPGWDKYSGYGRVNLFNAIAAAPGLRVGIDYPTPNLILSGSIDISGLADGEDFTEYVLEYGQGANPSSWTEITTSTTPVTDGILGTWNADDLNGLYTIRVRAAGSNSHQVTVTLTNSAIAEITDPLPMDTITCWTPITGSASCPDFDYYKVEFGGGSSPYAWNEISEAYIPKANAQLAIWNTDGLSMGLYTIRVSLFSNSGMEAADSVLVYIAPPFQGENGWKVSLGTRVCNIVNYGDFDNDGANEIILGTDQGMKFFNPDGSPKTSGIPSIPDYDFTVPFGVGDLDNDGIDDFAAVGVTGSNARLMGFPSTAPPFEVDLPEIPNLTRLESENIERYPYVALKDINSDGKDEIHYYRDGICDVYNPDGTLKIALQVNGKYLSADLNNDGVDEFYVSDYGLLQLDTSGALLDVAYLGHIYCQTINMSAVDMDQDGKLELILQFLDPIAGENHMIYAFDENLSLKPGWPRDTGIDIYLIPVGPIFADFDKDASLEYFMAFYELSEGSVWAWHADGTPYMGDSIYPLFANPPNPSRLHTCILGDVDGDLYPDLISYATNDMFSTYPVERLVAWDRNGDLLDGWPLTTKPAGAGSANHGTHIPTVGDINKDGNVDIVTTTSNNDLVFQNFGNTPYYPSNVPVPSWRYNRRINNVAPIRVAACGDTNGDQTVNVSDAVYLINYIFAGGSAPNPYTSGDVNCDDLVNVSDAVWIINYIFIGGKSPCDTDGDGLPDC